MARTDLEALHERLPPDECTGCVDGIDIVIEIIATEPVVMFDSLDVELDEDEELLALTWDIVRSVPEAGLPPIETDF